MTTSALPRALPLAAGCNQLINWGISFYMPGTFARAISADKGWSSVQIYLGLTFAMLVIYYGFIGLIAFGKPLLATKVAGTASLGLVLGVGVIVFAFVLTGIYVVRANTRFDTLAADLAALIEERDLKDVSLVGFSMGGGEVARYIGNHGEDRLHSVVFASAVPPYLLKTDDNPDGPLPQAKADEMRQGLEKDREEFFDGFTRDFFSANGKLKVTEEERQAAIALCHQSDQTAALGCMKAFATTDFRADLKRVTVPALILHGDADATVPFEGSGERTHAALAGSELVLLKDAPHGCNTSHADDFNLALLNFLKK